MSLVIAPVLEATLVVSPVLVGGISLENLDGYIIGPKKKLS